MFFLTNGGDKSEDDWSQPAPPNFSVYLVRFSLVRNPFETKF